MLVVVPVCVRMTGRDQRVQSRQKGAQTEIQDKPDLLLDRSNHHEMAQFFFAQPEIFLLD